MVPVFGLGALLALLATPRVHSAELQHSGLSHRAPLSGTEGPQDATAEAGSNREKKFLSVFQIVKFKNEACPANNGDTGICFTETECADRGGVAAGDCASAFGVCCVFTVSTCDSSLDQNNTYIQSPGYPAAAPLGMCSYTMNKCDSNICQFRLEFEDVIMSGPEMGDCMNDTITITGVDSLSAKVVPPELCGSLTGQHMVVSVVDATAGAKIVFNVGSLSSSPRWRVRVVQLSCADTALLAPPGCLTYDMSEAGELQSYNYDNSMGQLINNQKFSHCIKSQDGFCDVALTATGFDMDSTGDWLSFSGMQQTGSGVSNFGTSGSLAWNFTGPYIATTCSDDMNTRNRNLKSLTCG